MSSRPTTPTPMRVACGQFTATSNPLQNLEACTRLVKLAADAGATILFLPEASDYIAPTPAIGLSLLTHNSTTAFLDGLCTLAHAHKLAINVGIHTPSLSSSTLARNTSVYISPAGIITYTYHKLHLFAISHSASSTTLSESSTTEAGTQLTPPIDTPVGSLGLQICFDIRFPEAAGALERMGGGVEVLAYPSAFTVPTGRAHWELLLRARAVEGQCWVVAAAQVGCHFDLEVDGKRRKRESWGEAMVVDPWGVVKGRCRSIDEDGKEEICVVDIDHEVTRKVRAEMALVRRADVYGSA